LLHIVPTPLGNLEDITLRALRVLRACALVLCEDTRRTRGLLTRFDVHAPTERYSDRDPRGLSRWMRLLEEGKDLALVSDSGTPVLSDPGVALVAECRRRGLPVASLPGPCAAAAALAGSGLPGDAFVFLGFLPRSPSRRRKALRGAAALGLPVVVYESPFRVLALLEQAREALGDGARAAVARELTKMHEEWLTGPLPDVLAALSARKERLGEFVVVLAP
jgi:16S rRNA (cytidine1402-2'-O)-methyltransferase